MSAKRQYSYGTGMWERFRNRFYPMCISYYRIGKQTVDKPHKTHEHTHDFPQALYCLRGSYTHTVGEHEYSCEPGSLIIIPSGTPHYYEVARGMDCEFVQINILLNFFDNYEDKAQLTAIAHLFLFHFANELKFEMKTHILFSGERKEKLERWLSVLTSHDWSKRASSYRMLQKSFLDIFTLPEFDIPEKAFLRIPSFLEAKYIPVLRSVYYMNLHYSEKITVDELTEVSGLCRTHYFRYIKKLVGCTFSIYLQGLRVSHAEMLCKFSRFSFSYIADVCGFGNHGYMNDRIKKFISSDNMPTSLRKQRSEQIERWPEMIMSRKDYEELSPHFHAFGL